MRAVGIPQGQVEVAAGPPTLPNEAACRQLCPASSDTGGSVSVLHLDAAEHGVVTSLLLPQDQ